MFVLSEQKMAKNADYATPARHKVSTGKYPSHFDWSIDLRAVLDFAADADNNIPFVPSYLMWLIPRRILLSV